MIWLYLAWFILLTGSQVAFYLQHPKLVKLAGKPLILSPRLREREGLWLMTVIARRFCQNQPPLTIQHLEEQTGLTNNAVQDLLTSLEKGGFLIEIAGDETRYVPSCDVATIKVAALLNCLRTAEENSAYHVKGMMDKDVNKLLKDIGDAQAEVLGDLTLRELAMRKDGE